MAYAKARPVAPARAKQALGGKRTGPPRVLRTDDLASSVGSLTQDIEDGSPVELFQPKTPNAAQRVLRNNKKGGTGTDSDMGVVVDVGQPRAREEDKLQGRKRSKSQRRDGNGGNVDLDASSNVAELESLLDDESEWATSDHTPMPQQSQPQRRQQQQRQPQPLPLPPAPQQQQQPQPLPLPPPPRQQQQQQPGTPRASPKVDAFAPQRPINSAQTDRPRPNPNKRQVESGAASAGAFPKEPGAPLAALGDVFNERFRALMERLERDKATVAEKRPTASVARKGERGQVSAPVERLEITDQEASRVKLQVYNHGDFVILKKPVFDSVARFFPVEELKLGDSPYHTLSHAIEQVAEDTADAINAAVNIDERALVPYNSSVARLSRALFELKKAKSQRTDDRDLEQQLATSEQTKEFLSKQLQDYAQQKQMWDATQKALAGFEAQLLAAEYALGLKATAFAAAEAGAMVPAGPRVMATAEDIERWLQRLQRVAQQAPVVAQNAVARIQPQPQLVSVAPPVQVKQTDAEVMQVLQPVLANAVVYDTAIRRWFGLGALTKAGQISEDTQTIYNALTTIFGADLNAAKSNLDKTNEALKKAENARANWKLARAVFRTWLLHEGLKDADKTAPNALINSASIKLNEFITYNIRTADLPGLVELKNSNVAAVTAAKASLAKFRGYFQTSDSNIDDGTEEPSLEQVFRIQGRYIDALRGYFPVLAQAYSVYTSANAIKVTSERLLALAGAPATGGWLENQATSETLVTKATSNLQKFIKDWNSWEKTHRRLLAAGNWFWAHATSGDAEPAWLSNADYEVTWSEGVERTRKELSSTASGAAAVAELKRTVETKTSLVTQTEEQVKTLRTEVETKQKRLAELQTDVQTLTLVQKSFTNAAWAKRMAANTEPPEADLKGWVALVGAGVEGLETKKQDAERQAQEQKTRADTLADLIESNRKKYEEFSKKFRVIEAERAELTNQLEQKQLALQEKESELRLAQPLQPPRAKAITATAAADGTGAMALEPEKALYNGIELPFTFDELDSIKTLGIEQKIAAIRKVWDKSQDPKWSDKVIEGISVRAGIGPGYLSYALGLRTKTAGAGGGGGGGKGGGGSGGSGSSKGRASFDPESIGRELELVRAEIVRGQKGGPGGMLVVRRPDLVMPPSDQPAGSEKEDKTEVMGSTTVTVVPVFHPDKVFELVTAAPRKRREDDEPQKPKESKAVDVSDEPPRPPPGLNAEAQWHQLVQALMAELARLRRQLVTERRVAVTAVGKLHVCIEQSLTQLVHMAPDSVLQKPNTDSVQKAQTELTKVDPEVFPYQTLPATVGLTGSTPSIASLLTGANAVKFIEGTSVDAAQSASQVVNVVGVDRTAAVNAAERALQLWDNSHKQLAEAQINDQAVTQLVTAASQQVALYGQAVQPLLAGQNPQRTEGADAFSWAKVLAVVNVDISNMSQVVNKAFLNATNMFNQLASLQRDATLMHNELQSFISMSSNLVQNYVREAQSFMGEDEQKFTAAVALGNEVRKLHGRFPDWTEGAHQLLRTTFLVLASMSRGRLETNDLLRRRLNAVERPIHSQSQLVLTSAIKQLIIGNNASGPATTQLVHWGHHFPETAKWMSHMHQWSVTGLRDLMIMPDECIPGVTELLHVNSSRTFTKPQILCLGFWSFTEVSKALARAHVGTWFAMTNATACFLSLERPAIFPFPCDANTLVLTDKPWSTAVAQLQSYFDLKDLTTDSVLPDSRVELVYANRETGEIGAFPDLTRTSKPTAAVLKVHGDARQVVVVPSMARSTEDLVVRVRWLRFARRLRDFESLVRVPIDEARAVLTKVYQTANSNINVFLDLPPLETSSTDPHLGGAPVMEGRSRDAAYGESLHQIEADTRTYAETQQLQRFGGNTQRRQQRQQQQQQQLLGFGDGTQSLELYEYD